MSGRRVYSAAKPGLSAPLWFYRTMVFVFGPFFCLALFCWTLVAEIARAFRFAWTVEVRGFWKEVRNHWNGDRPT